MTPYWSWENMTTELDEESSAFSLSMDGKEVGHIFSEDGDSWGAFLGDPTNTVEVGRATTRAGAKRSLVAAAKQVRFERLHKLPANLG